MPPVPTKSIKSERPQQVSVSTANVYNEYGQSLDEILQKEKTRQFHQKNQTEEKIRSATRASDTQDGEYVIGEDNLRSAVFTNVISEGKYSLTLDSLDWLEESGSTLEIGYNSGGEFTVMESYSSETLPEDRFFTIDLPEGTVINSIEVRMRGGYTTVHLKNVTDTESCVHFDKEQELGDDDKEMARHNITAMIDLLDSGVSLTDSEKETILSKLGLDNLLTRLEQMEQDILDCQTATSDIGTMKERLVNHENRISSLEQA